MDTLQQQINAHISLTLQRRVRYSHRRSGSYSNNTKDRASLPGDVCRMLNYTERLTLLMQDVVSRVPTLSFIDMRDVLVFARAGRSNAEGAFATCHCLSCRQRAGLLLLARSHDAGADAPLGVVRHEVAGGDDRHARRSST